MRVRHFVACEGSAEAIFVALNRCNMSGVPPTAAQSGRCRVAQSAERSEQHPAVGVTDSSALSHQFQFVCLAHSEVRTAFLRDNHRA